MGLNVPKCNSPKQCIENENTLNLQDLPSQMSRTGTGSVGSSSSVATSSSFPTQREFSDTSPTSCSSEERRECCSWPWSGGRGIWWEGQVPGRGCWGLGWFWPVHDCSGRGGQIGVSCWPRGGGRARCWRTILSGAARSEVRFCCNCISYLQQETRFLLWSAESFKLIEHA